MRSITSRNIAGGFLGGVLGILACAWNWQLLPAGCLLGVLVGFFGDVMLVWIGSGLMRAVAGMRRCMDRLLVRIAIRSTAAGRVFARTTRRLGAYARTACLVLAAIFTALVTAPANLRAWHSAHPFNKALMLRVAACVALVLLNLLCMYFTDFSSRWSILSFSLFSTISYGSGFQIWGGRLGPDLPAARVREFYTVWQRYSEGGRGAFFLQELATVAKLQAFMASLALIMMAVVSIGLPGLVLLTITIVVLRGSYEIARAGGFWFSLFVTLGVTGSAAWFGRSYLEGSRLWLLALVSGCLSGLASEGCRRLYLAFWDSRDSRVLWLYRNPGTHLDGWVDAWQRHVTPYWRRWTAFALPTAY